MSGAERVVTVAGALSADALPEVSKARTRQVWVDAAPSPVSVYPGWITFATMAPSRYTSYPATPTLSFEAAQASTIEVTSLPVGCTPVGTDGGATSGSIRVVAVIVVLVAEMLPAASKAATWYRYLVCAARPLSVYPGR